MSASDVSSVTKHFPVASEGFSTTTSGTVTAGATSVGLNSTSGLTNGNVFVGIIDPGVANKEQTFTGTVDVAGAQLTNVVWTRGTNVDHAGGATIVDYVTGTGRNMVTKGILVAHNQDGTHKSGAAYALPLITDFTNATHTHANAAGGGTLAAAAVPALSLASQTLSNPYKFRAYRVAALTYGAGVFTDVAPDTEVFDTNNNFSAGAYTAPVTGFYCFFGQGAFLQGADNSDQTIAVFVNGVEHTRGNEIFGTASTTGGLVVSALINVTAGDVITLRVYVGHAKTANVNAPAINYFSGFLVSTT